jgi:chromatin remodeling complex protein RSC6
MPRSEVVKRMWAYFKEHNLLVNHPIESLFNSSIMF